MDRERRVLLYLSIGGAVVAIAIGVVLTLFLDTSEYSVVLVSIGTAVPAALLFTSKLGREIVKKSVTAPKDSAGIEIRPSEKKTTTNGDQVDS